LVVKHYAHNVCNEALDLLRVVKQNLGFSIFPREMNPK
jgi:hypothetical protein